MYANCIGMPATLISFKLYLICFNSLLHANHGNLYQNYLLLQWQAIYKHLANVSVLSVVPYVQMHAEFIACLAINNSLHRIMWPKSKKCIHKHTRTRTHCYVWQRPLGDFHSTTIWQCFRWVARMPPLSYYCVALVRRKKKTVIGILIGIYISIVLYVCVCVYFVYIHIYINIHVYSCFHVHFPIFDFHSLRLTGEAILPNAS